MRRICGIALVLMIVVLTATAAPAPEARPLGGLMTLNAVCVYLRDMKFREELQLSEDQVKRIEDLQAAQRQTLAELRSRSKEGLSKEEAKQKRAEAVKANELVLEKILSRKQIKRVEQIFLHQVGPMIAFRKPQVAAALQLTDEQKGKIDLIRTDKPQELRSVPARGVERQAWLQKLLESHKIQEEKVLNVLTPAQQAKWKQLIGKPFKLNLRRIEEKKEPGQVSDRPASAK